MGSLVKCFSVSFLILAGFGCASQPKLYPNKKYNETGKQASQAEIEECSKLADQHLESTKGRKIAEGAGTGAVAGGALGAVAGAFTGSPGWGALTGAAVGATAGGIHGAVSPEHAKKAFVERCLKDKGYDVIGWD